MKRTLKNLLYSIPIAVASFLPMNKTNGQVAKSNFFSNKWENDKPSRIEKPNSISLGVQPIDLGLSIGYSRKITPRIGTYLFLSKGKYSSPFDFDTDGSENSHVDHYKIALGGTIHTPKDKNGSSAFISFGSSFSVCNKKHYEPGTINEKAFRKLSFEGGAGVTLAGKINVGFLFDPFKGESNMYVGFPFGYH